VLGMIANRLGGETHLGLFDQILQNAFLQSMGRTLSEMARPISDVDSHLLSDKVGHRI
jgi:hypothetical protein